ncbi:IQ calmodulin-binding motif-containing protein 1 isoform X2 [Acanthochromis polyacanthus]|uniref:IQ calmodulin-binding motif-containing protein 1 isoform X2 n=1 Tax=Acanthochromis polyacanthus TaxID=80966 RepID=UPI002234404C|nr:IQ calmodulin-binding motif-containing protein 1 isoform X2 [Acanthochromis polyacanthus]
MEEEELQELKRKLENEDLDQEQRINLLNSSLSTLNSAALQPDGGVSSSLLKSRLYLSGVLNLCVAALNLRKLQNDWSAMATLAHLTCCCCVGVKPGRHSEAFHRLFLPSVMDAVLSLAGQLMRRSECWSQFRKTMKDSVGRLLEDQTHLTPHILSSAHYEQIQMCDDVAVTLLCVQMWIQICSTNRKFLSELSDDSALLLLNEAVGQLALSSDPAVGRASVTLILLMANQLKLRLRPLLLSFRGLDSLLDKDWRGRGFDQDLDQLITLVQSEQRMSHSEASTEHVQAVCVIQAAWCSYRTRRRVKSLNRAVGALQRRYRARRRQQQQQREVQRWQEELSYQVFVRRQQARRRFHQKQRRLLQLLPPDQVASYLQEVERRAAVVIQSFWRGFRERQRYNNTQRHTLRETHNRQQAAMALQRVVRRFLEERRAAKALPTAAFWIGQEGLTDSRRAELKRQVEEHIAVNRSSCVSPQQCKVLHHQVQQLLQSELQRRLDRMKEDQHLEALMAHTHTQLELLRDAPPLSVVTATDADSFLSPSGSIAARGRDAHNAALQAERLPWWRTLGRTDEGPAHPQEAELEAELGGLYVGGVREVDGTKL